MHGVRDRSWIGGDMPAAAAIKVTSQFIVAAAGSKVAFASITSGLLLAVNTPVTCHVCRQQWQQVKQT